MKNIFVIAIAGGSCSGKTIFAGLFKQALILEMDHFYKPKAQLVPEPDGTFNYDAPAAIDIKQCSEVLETLKQGRPATIPVYDMKLSDRVGTKVLAPPKNCKFLIIEGIFALYSPLREMADLKIYIDVPPEIRVARRMLRDVQKGRNETETLMWSITVEKNHRAFVEPQKLSADLVIPFSYNPVQFGKNE